MKNENCGAQISKFLRVKSPMMVPMIKELAETTFVQELRLVPDIKIRIDEPLGRYTTMKIGGPADYFLEIGQRAALVQTLRLLKRHRIPFYLLGKGSNTLVSDLGVRGAVIRLSGDFLQLEWEEDHERIFATVGAAYPVTRLVRESARRGYSGLEFAEGIPGSVGGALVMNAGAYGTEMEKLVDRVEGVSPAGELVSFERKELAFSYRDSHLPVGTVVTSVRMHLAKGDAMDVTSRVRQLVVKRKKSQPSGYPNSGSMFRNPVGDYAGRLIEAAGLKGKRIGKAEISKQHANFIVNLGGAKAGDVKSLMENARNEVQKQFGIELIPEVRWLGE